MGFGHELGRSGERVVWIWIECGQWEQLGCYCCDDRSWWFSDMVHFVIDTGDFGVGSVCVECWTNQLCSDRKCECDDFGPGCIGQCGWRIGGVSDWRERYNSNDVGEQLGTESEDDERDSDDICTRSGCDDWRWRHRCIQNVGSVDTDQVCVCRWPGCVGNCTDECGRDRFDECDDSGIWIGSSGLFGWCASRRRIGSRFVSVGDTDGTFLQDHVGRRCFGRVGSWERTGGVGNCARR